MIKFITNMNYEEANNYALVVPVLASTDKFYLLLNNVTHELVKLNK